jgi:hypothetical protein
LETDRPTHRLGWAITLIVVIAIAAAFALDGDNSGSSTSAAATTDAPTVTTSATEPAPTTTAPKYVIPAETSPPTTDDGLNLLGGDSPEDKRMPDVVCMNLQDAQDEIQDHGVFFSKSVDATGDDRRQIIDSNWIVVAQTPAAGDKIGEGDALLSVVKTDEPNDCP